jgi:hypothetical protein
LHDVTFNLEDNVLISYQHVGWKRKGTGKEAGGWQDMSHDVTHVDHGVVFQSRDAWSKQ